MARVVADANMAFVDVEASGFGGKSYPIEIGCVLPSGESYCTLIRPQQDWQHWDEQAASVHGIARDLLFKHGRDIEVVAEDLNTRLLGHQVISDAWYHDYNWIQRLFDAAELFPRFTLLDLRDVLDEPMLARWDALKSTVQAELSLTRHRASNDARILQTTYRRVLDA